VDFINRHKLILFFRIFFCTLLVTIWVIWLTNLPKPVPEQKTIPEKHLPEITFLGKESLQAEQIKKITSIKTTVTQEDTKQEETTKVIAKTTPIPKAETKVIVKITPIPKAETKIIAKTAPSPKAEIKANTTALSSPTPQQQIKKPELVVNLPQVASATRNILLNAKPTPQSMAALQAQSDTSLRKEVHIDRAQHKPIYQKALIGNEQEEAENSWLPKYILETKEKIEPASNNPDEIANQLELTGLIANPDGEKAAIFRNKSNNQTEILKQGQEYLNLKVIEITQEFVILENESLSKKYLKTLEPSSSK